jgi:integrase
MHKQKLTALAVERRAKNPGIYGDGGGLYLLVGSKRPGHGGTCSWVFRYMRHGKAHSMGLGRYPDRSLAEARERAMAARRLLIDGIDPIEQRGAISAQAELEAAKAVTFKDSAEGYIAAHQAGWRNAKHAYQWRATLATYAFPLIGALPVAAIDTGLMMKVLEPIWTAKPETATRLRGRVEAILDWARVRGYRAGENPARWRGHLENLLPSKGKVQKVKHHAALPFDSLPGFMAALRQQQGIAAHALEFAILTAARTGEVIGATWAEINLVEKMWIVPGERMKAGREHRVPLSARAVLVLQDMAALRENREPTEFVFPGAKRSKPLSNMAMLALLRRMGHRDLTAHGFRSTFRDWGAERTNFPSEVAEMALAHAVGDKVEAAYRRGDLFEKRRALMDQWATVCGMPATDGGSSALDKAAELN